ncbi:uncharacterized protein LOC131612572 [Vicia villosa]|uniref:uncharacterized protein LOC131612572 n=1 Tax=Vicia villosa TaxID=3911 RepID=UPI00273A9997|nr:uncharacterized protein LOC131612572 [Vicia villosa]
MSHNEHKAAKIISKEVDDERRLHICAKKYETIIKQFDELMEIMNADNTLVQPRKRQKRSGSNASTSTSSHQLYRESNEVILQTVTKFLQELGANPSDSDS